MLTLYVQQYIWIKLNEQMKPNEDPTRLSGLVKGPDQSITPTMGELNPV